MNKRIASEGMSFLQHLEDLRWHLVRSVAAIVIVGIVAFVFHDFIFDHIILKPKTAEFLSNKYLCKLGKFLDMPPLCINSQPLEIINLFMAGQFSTHIKVSLMAGIILAFPYLIFEIWKFLKPALHANEKKQTGGVIFSCSILFTIGILFGYYIITPLSIHFLGSYSVSNDVQNTISLKSYISTITSVVFASGVIFELPIIIYFLAKMGLASPAFLKKYRKHSLVVILALSAIITPPDIFSQVLVAVPLLILYETGIIISRRIEKKRAEGLSF